ncbi:hypothetical protein TWF696_004076 [Orbilia brochopaga]|uniref:Uncharacterized protein n=1 Tax=Orbilia brochopaga TaxID=3140254 RepID=A0AAV9V5C0_9PEZI
MATTIQHACNRESGADSEPSANINVFIHDANNVAAIQNARVQRKRAEEAARRRVEEMEAAAKELASEVVDKEKAQQDLIALRSKHNTLNSQYASLNNTLLARNEELAKANKEIEKLKEEMRQAEITTNNEKANLQAQAKRDIEKIKAEKQQAENNTNSVIASMRMQAQMGKLTATMLRVD